MKKIVFSLHIGLIGSNESGRNVFLDFLRKESIPVNDLNNDKEQNHFLQFILVYKDIPIKIKVFQANDLTTIIDNYKQIKNIDVLILALNLYHLNSKNEYCKDDLEKFIKTYAFKGVSGLIGFDMERILKGNISKNFRISRYNLIEKVKELDLMYCFEIKNEFKDMIELYQTLLNDYIFKLKISNPELIEKAKSYGKELVKLKSN
ncbi:MAG: hypothetical protein ACFFBP_15175 [Promethearchaeota archaeon]